MFFESHAHYDDSRYDEDRGELLESLKENKVDYVINVGADIPSSKASVALSEKYDFLYASVGVHPHEAERLTDAGFDILYELTQSKKVVAIGEIGLDFYYDYSNRDAQRDRFKRQLKLAGELNLPVIIHSRDAAQETFDIIKSSGLREGVIHCYTGSAQMAEEYVKLGFYIGLGGIITFPKARVSVEVAEAVSLDKILIETDCPYLSPVPNRGKRNDSINLLYIAQKIAEIKKATLEEVAEVTMRNAKECFRLNA